MKDLEGPSHQAPAPLITNRLKAVIAINMYAIILFCFATLIKITVNEKKVNALDICFIRTLTLLVFSFIGAKCFG